MSDDIGKSFGVHLRKMCVISPCKIAFLYIIKDIPDEIYICNISLLWLFKVNGEMLSSPAKCHFVQNYHWLSPIYNKNEALCRYNEKENS